MGIRHYFIINYVAGSDRKEITLTELRDDNYDVSESNFDLVSRQNFEWYVFSQEELDRDDSIFNRNPTIDRLKKEKEAANYARELAQKHGLKFIGQSNLDGILD